MGMDVIGVNPKSEKGSYFRNNVWWWRPLSGYVQENHPHIAEHCEYWDSNDGDGLDEEKSIMLALALLDDIKEGKVAEYERSYNEWRASLPREACNLCDCTGIRTDAIGVEHGMPERELAPEIQILTGRTHGYCNACQGVGTTESFMGNYPFSQENVQEFAEFLMDCGGFQIC